MKNISLLLFCFISSFAFSQSNEINLSYQSLANDDYGKGTAISYYRNLTSNYALGLKFNVNELEKEDFFSSLSRSGSIDLVNRWNTSSAKRLRFMTEFGFSYLRNYEKPELFFFCGNTTEEEMRHYLANNPWRQTSHIGFTAAIGFDVMILQQVRLGTSYHLGKYFPTADDNSNPGSFRRNLNINLGLNF